MDNRLKAVYSKVHGRLPHRMQVILSQAVFRFGGKPYIYFDENLHPKRKLPRGVVTFSADFELAWAWQFSKTHNHRYAEIAARSRRQVPQLLSVMEECEIPITWATVGHLFLHGCSKLHHRPHHQMPRPEYFETSQWRYDNGDWYQNDPCSTVEEDPLWYAPDLIQQILDSPVKHEVACHSFSHMGFGSYCHPEVATAELDESLAAMQPFGIRPHTFVHPGNDEGHLDIIASRGFRIVRIFPQQWAEISLPVKIQNGLWGVHSSTPVDLEGDAWDLSERLARLKRYVDVAEKKRLAAHFWFHPSLPENQFREILIPLFEYCAKRKNRNKLDILTMEQLVAATEAALVKEGREPCAV